MKKMTEDAILKGMVAIETLNQDQFLLVRETLTRIGVPSRKSVADGERPILYQSVHVLHKKGKYYLTHFKQLFLLDGRFNRTNFTEEDQERLLLVAKLLSDWNLIKPIQPIPVVESVLKLTVLPYNEKDKWDLRSKYRIGKKGEWDFS